MSALDLAASVQQADSADIVRNHLDTASVECRRHGGFACSGLPQKESGASVHSNAAGVKWQPATLPQEMSHDSSHQKKSDTNGVAIGEGIYNDLVPSANSESRSVFEDPNFVVQSRHPIAADDNAGTNHDIVVAFGRSQFSQFSQFNF
jgi:hypothetical protein